MNKITLPPAHTFTITFADGTTVETKAYCHMEAVIHAASEQLRQVRSPLVVNIHGTDGTDSNEECYLWLSTAPPMRELQRAVDAGGSARPIPPSREIQRRERWAGFCFRLFQVLFWITVGAAIWFAVEFLLMLAR